MERTCQRPMARAFGDSRTGQRVTRGGLGREGLVWLLRVWVVFGLLLIEFAGLAIVQWRAVGRWGKGSNGAFANTYVLANSDFDTLVSKGTRKGG